MTDSRRRSPEPADAIGAAVDAQRALLAERWPDPVDLRVRMGLHTGEAQERDGDYFGPPLNLAARLMGAAGGGQIVVSEVTAAVLAGRSGVALVDLGGQRLRGVADPVRAFGVVTEGVVGWGPPADPAAAAGAAGRSSRLPVSNLPRERQALPFVGRQVEMLSLREWWERDVDTRMVLRVR